MNIPKNDKLALLDQDRASFTYNELHHFVENHEACFTKGQLIFVLCENKAPLLPWFFSMLKAQAVPLLLARGIDQSLLFHLIETYEPSHLFYREGDDLSMPGSILFSEEGYSFIELSKTAPPLHEDLEMLLSTSGSTGSPKLVRFQRGLLFQNALNVKNTFNITEDEVHAATLPINYVMGLNALMSHLVAGATCLLSDFNILDQGLWTFLREHEATNFTGVPFSYEVLLRLGIKRLKIPSLTTFYQGGGKLKDSLFKKMATLSKEEGYRFIATYGTTETMARCSYLEPSMALEKVGSIGQAIEGVNLSLKDGELIVTGNNVSMGYALSKEDLLKGDEFLGSFATGDLATVDDEGYFTITGRKKRFVKLLGNRIGLDEVELLLKEASIEPVASMGKDDALLIVLTREEQKEETLDLLSKTLSLHRSLFKVKVLDSIPLLPNGKTDYQRIEKELGGPS